MKDFVQFLGGFLLIAIVICIPAGSGEDVASSSSEGDEHLIIPGSARESGHNVFGRRQISGRDSGCYDASLTFSRKKEHIKILSQGESDASDSVDFSDTKNNLDSIVKQCNNEILARVQQANLENEKEELSYQLNIPNTIPNYDDDGLQRKSKDSYVKILGQITLVDPCHQNVLTRVSDLNKIAEICEKDQKFTSAKYVVGGTSDFALNESGFLHILGRSCLSEKSSDSGVSTSSLSSGNIKESRPIPSQLILDPSHRNVTLSECASCTYTSTANK